jgi:TolB-like protein/Flp pilus assembly protein TadD
MTIDLAKEAEFDLGGLRIRPPVRQVESRGGAETLEPRIMQVLVVLGRKRGDVVSRDELIELCWEGRAVSDDAINRCTARIRKLGEAHDDFRLETIPRVGYRLTSAESEAATEPAGKQGHAPTLAILPFANRSGLPEDEAFAQSLVQDTIAALSRGVNVRPLASIATAGIRRDALRDFPALGRQLGARYLIEGNLRRIGNQLRVTAQLVETATGAVLWSSDFDAPLRASAASCERVAAELAAAIDVQIQTQLVRAPRNPSEVTAWEAVMRSNAAFRNIDDAGIGRSIEEAEHALAIAPDYALAHAQLATARAVRYLMQSPDDPTEVQQIRSLAHRALALEADDVFVLTTVANALALIGYPQEALYQLNRAMRKSPDTPRVRYALGVVLGALDRPDEALAHLEVAEQSMQGAVLLYLVKWWQTVALARAGRWEETLTVVDDLMVLNPDHEPARVLKAVLCWRNGRAAEARGLIDPLKSRQRRLEQALIPFRRTFAGAPALEGIEGDLRALWAEAAGQGGVSQG